MAALADSGAMAATDIARQVVSTGLGCQHPLQGPDGAEEIWPLPPPPQKGRWATFRSQGTVGLLLPGSAAQSRSLSLRAAAEEGSWGAWPMLWAGG